MFSIYTRNNGQTHNFRMRATLVDAMDVFNHHLEKSTHATVVIYNIKDRVECEYVRKRNYYRGQFKNVVKSFNNKMQIINGRN